LYSQHRGLAIEDLFQGIIDVALMYLREVIKPCLGQKAATVNLGSKLLRVADPSQVDIAIKGKLKRALEAMYVIWIIL